MTKPALEHLPVEYGSSFVVKDFDYAYYPTPWHFHPEYEIVLVTESTGKRYIGNHISDFAPGNLALIGPNIPHTYKNDKKYYEEGSTLRAKSIVIHFLEASIGKDFFTLPEAENVKNLLARSINGFHISGKTNKSVSNKLMQMVELTGLKRWLTLLDILNEIAESSDKTPITKGLEMGQNQKESDRLCKVFDWVTSNFENEIKLSDAAKIANMNEYAFSRFFSLRTRKTFTEFVQELRLKKAAKLLMENELSITSICYDCGYNNISNFNRQFLRHFEMSPLKYRQSFLQQSK